MIYPTKCESLFRGRLRQMNYLAPERNICFVHGFPDIRILFIGIIMMRLILIALLILTSLLPLQLGLHSIFDPGYLLDNFGLGHHASDSKRLMYMLGAFILTAVAFQWVAAFWVYKKKLAGINLSLLIGLFALMRGLIILSANGAQGVNAPNIGAVAAIIGLVILLFGFLAKRELKQGSHGTE